MTYTVIFAPEALNTLEALEDYIGYADSAATAAAFIDNIVDFCESLSTFPYRGVKRDDILQGLYVTHYRKNTIIAYIVDPLALKVSIVGVFYGGQDYATLLQYIP